MTGPTGFAKGPRGDDVDPSPTAMADSERSVARCSEWPSSWNTRTRHGVTPSGIGASRDDWHHATPVAPTPCGIRCERATSPRGQMNVTFPGHRASGFTPSPWPSRSTLRGDGSEGGPCGPGSFLASPSGLRFSLSLRSLP